MTSDSVRQLAAVMFTDIVGYTALVQSDEEEARAVRARHAGVLEPSITEHGGRLLQSFGDGTLSVFPSAVEAVACAVAIQRNLQLGFDQDPQQPQSGSSQGEGVFVSTGPQTCYEYSYQCVNPVGQADDSAFL